MRSQSRKRRQPNKSPAGKAARESSPEVALAEAQAAFAQKAWRRATAAARRWRDRDADPLFGSWSALAAEAHFRQGLALLAEGRPRAVPDEMEQAVAWCPGDATYLFHLGLAHHRLGQWEQAITAYKRAWEIQPSFRVVYHEALATLQSRAPEVTAQEWAALRSRLQQVAPRRAQGRTAINRLESWWAVAQEDAPEVAPGAEAWRRSQKQPLMLRAEVGFFALAAGDHLTALSALKRIPTESTGGSTDDDLPLGHRMVALAALGLASAIVGSEAELEDSLVAALEEWGFGEEYGYPPELPRPATRYLSWLLWRVAWRHMHDQRPDEAVPAYGMMGWLRVNPLQALHGLALACEQDDQYFAAMEGWPVYLREFEAEAGGLPREQREWMRLLVVQGYLHLIDMADEIGVECDVAWVQAALHYPINDPETRLQLAEAASDIQEERLVKTALRPLHHQATRDAPLAIRVANCYRSAGLSAEARTILEKAVQADPEAEEASKELAEMLRAEGRGLMASGDRVGALRALERSAHLDSTNAETEAALGALYLAEGRRVDAEARFRRATDLESSVGTLLDIARLVGLVGLTDQASAYFDRALEKDDGPTTRLHVALGYLHLGLEPQLLERLRRDFRDKTRPVQPYLLVAANRFLYRSDLVVKMLGELQRFRPGAFEVPLALCIVHLGDGNLEAAIAAAGKVENLARRGKDNRLAGAVRQQALRLKRLPPSGPDLQLALDGVREVLERWLLDAIVPEG
jgi:tetratricopeptide (TPR) repeat protein